MLTIKETTHEIEYKGETRRFIRYTPVLKNNPVYRYPCFSGELKFSAWEAWEDEPDHRKEQVKTIAMNNAKTILQTIADCVLRGVNP